MRVLNIAHVEAQFPLLTEKGRIICVVALIDYQKMNVPMATLLYNDDQAGSVAEHEQMDK